MAAAVAGRQLFVGNLPFIIGWQELKDLFRSAGTVVRADVASTPSGRSRGFGTVLFASQEDAQNAIDTYNGYEWHGRKIEVREDNKVRSEEGQESAPVKEQHVEPVDPNSINTTSLYIGNLPWSVGWQDLKDLFRQAGTVVRADIPQDYQGRSKGFGTVVMQSVEDARKAVAMFNGFDWNGRKIEVRNDRTAERSAPAPAAAAPAAAAVSPVAAAPAPVAVGSAAGRTLFVGNLPFTVQWQELKDLFRQCGNVMRADVAVDGQGRSRGYGTVVMATAEEAGKAVTQLNGIQIQGRIIEVREDKFAAEQAAAEPGTQVFVGNLPFSTRWQDLKDLFRPYGLQPTHADILVENGTGRSKGCGIVKFGTKEEGEKAVKEVNGIHVLGREIVVKLDKFAHPQ